MSARAVGVCFGLAGGWVGPLLLVVAAVLLGLWSAWPIYDTPWLWCTGVLALTGGVSAAGLNRRWGWHAPAALALLVGVWAVLVVPATMPQVLLGEPVAWLRGVWSAVTALVFSWKQLLTVSLPVGSYESLLVPLFTVLLVSVWAIVWLVTGSRSDAGTGSHRGSSGSGTGVWAAWAAVPLALPVVFGTLWGTSAVSAPLITVFGTVWAPREIATWCAGGVLAVAWVAWVTGAERRAARVRGRVSAELRPRAARPLRAVWAVGLVAVSLSAAVVGAPLLTEGARAVPRTAVLPETVLLTQANPLAGYRASKSDENLNAPLLTVQSAGALPERLRFAVLDSFDGVEFEVGASHAGTFTRYPRGPLVDEPVELTVQFAEAYRGVWLPIAGLGSAPVFLGDRRAELTDSLYVNRGTDAAIVVPGGEHTRGVQAGDGYRATVSAVPAAPLFGGPASDTPLFDVSTTPELEAWLRVQDQPATAAGLTELVQRVRDRGYLSHGLATSDGEPQWAQQLAAEHGSVFVPSAGGHSLARLEALFAQLNMQQAMAGPDATAEQLVAAVGDDEQFAAASALIARALGFESRVVVGVRLASDAGDAAGAGEVAGVPSCAVTCTGEHLAAWIEVRGESGVWAPLDVTPQVGTAPTLLSEGAQLAEFDTVPLQRDALPVDAPVSVGDATDPVVSESDAPAGAAWWWPVLRGVALGALLLFLCVLPVVCVPVVKRWRSRRRRDARDPELAALAAWAEWVDLRRDAGVRVPAGVRSVVARAVGDPVGLWLAGEVDRAVWSAEGLSAGEVEQMWSVVDTDRASLRRSQTRWQRWRTDFSPRSLIRGDRPTLSTPRYPPPTLALTRTEQTRDRTPQPR